MADLIVNINLDESKKKNGLVVETYEGTIPHLKSRQFSGQLRNTNLMNINMVNNLSSTDLGLVQKIFNEKSCTQIKKHQYLFSGNTITKLPFLCEKGCLFYKEPKMPMYNVDYLGINESIQEDYISISHFYYFAEKEKLYIKSDFLMDIGHRETTPMFYIHLNNKSIFAELVFDYGTSVVSYFSKERRISSDEFRDYGFEQKIVNILHDCGWVYGKNSEFEFRGKDLYGSVAILEKNGIKLFTDQNKKVFTGTIANMHFSYGIDWFEIDGKIEIDGEKKDINDLIDFRLHKNNWIEVSGKIVLLPRVYKTIKLYNNSKSKTKITIDKDKCIDVLGLSQELGVNKIDNIDKMIDFTNTKLSISPKLMSILREYQLQGVKWMLSLIQHGFGCCLADDMGLGKTLQIIALLEDESMTNKKALVVVPKTLLINWNREFDKFAPNKKVYQYHGSNRNMIEAMKNDVIITTYQTLVNDEIEIQKLNIDILIVDEAQNIKNSKGKTYKCLERISVNNKILLTGTPVENNLQEYWNLMRLINKTSISYDKIKSHVQDNELVDKVRSITSPFLLRRYKNEVLKELPQKDEQIVYCSFGEEQQQLYNLVLESIRNEIRRKPDRFEMKSNSIVLNGLLYLQEICCHPRLIPREYNKNKCYSSAKLEQLEMMMEELYHSNHKIIIFSRFTKMLEIIRKSIIRKGFEYYYLDGKTKNRQEIVDEFEEAEIGIFLISLKAGGVGLNLVSADTAIIYDPWWNPAIEKQAEDRIYRIGQKNNVTIYKLLVANSIEEKILLLQDKKKELFQQVVEGHEMPMNIMLKDLESLLVDVD